jgi:hypothetical protein
MTTKKDPNDVSGMTAEERYAHVRTAHAARQVASATPHDLRVAEAVVKVHTGQQDQHEAERAGYVPEARRK